MWRRYERSAGSSQGLRATAMVVVCGLFAISIGCGDLFQSGNASGVVVLLDYSKTYAPYDEQDRTVLQTVQTAVSDLLDNGGLPQPVKMVWAAFGDTGLRPFRPCGPPRTYESSIIGRNAKKPKSQGSFPPLTNKPDLQAWFDTCLVDIVATSKVTQRFTDVSGAVAFATDALKDVDANRLVVMFSDLREDLPKEQPPVVAELNHESIVLLWRPGLDDMKRPDIVRDRAEQWVKTLTARGAARVCARQAQGVTGADIAKCAQGAEE